MPNSILQRVHDFIWIEDLATLSAMQRRVRHFMQIVVMVLRDLKEGQITLRAMGLVYTTLLSFVPLLAVSFSVLKGFGVHNQIEPFLLNFLSPLGDQSVEVTNNIVGFVENMKIGVLGAIGLGMLMYTVISLIQKIESALNFTWRLTANRNLAQRFSNYLSVVMVGPVLVFSAIGISASLKSQPIMDAIQTLPYMGEVIQFLGLLIPTVLIIFAFTFVYKLVPNTQVNFTSALYGAVISGILWRLTGNMFANFASGSTSYTAIYSGFAILLLFMIWLYLGWLILLIGASISYYFQNPHSLRYRTEKFTFSAIMREKMALQLMLEIGRAHFHPERYQSTEEALMDLIKAPQVMTRRMIQSLADASLIELSQGVGQGVGQGIGQGVGARYLPAASIENISVEDILKAARDAEDDGLSQQLDKSDVVNEIHHDISRAIDQSVSDKTLKDMVLKSL